MYRKKIEKLWKVYAIEIEIHSFFSRTRRRAAYHYIIEEKEGRREIHRFELP